MYHLCSPQEWLPPPSLDAASDFSCLSISWLSFFLSFGSLCSSVKLEVKQVVLECFLDSGWTMPGPYQETSQPAFCKQNPGFPQALQPAKGACLPHMGPQDYGIHLWLLPLTPKGNYPTVYSPLSFESPPRDTGPYLVAFLPFLPDYMCIFLLALVVLESFCQLPASFQWKFFHL